MKSRLAVTALENAVARREQVVLLGPAASWFGDQVSE
jgi:hypothetical protein